MTTGRLLSCDRQKRHTEGDARDNRVKRVARSVPLEPRGSAAVLDAVTDTAADTTDGSRVVGHELEGPSDRAHVTCD